MKIRERNKDGKGNVKEKRTERAKEEREIEGRKKEIGIEGSKSL